MTDLSPNVEVVLSSDLFDDDPCLESMSAPALAVLGAYMRGYGWLDGPTKKDCRGVAAVLRAVADQVVPETTTPWNSTLVLIMSTPEVRAKILALAAELEDANL